jgi:hypothetical protein
MAAGEDFAKGMDEPEPKKDGRERRLGGAEPGYKQSMSGMAMFHQLTTSYWQQ